MTRLKARTLCALLPVLAGGATLVQAPHAGNAAVSECLPMLEGKTAEAGTEIEARKIAMQDWLYKAKQLGAEYTRWQLAFNRQLTCQRTPAGAHQCRAVGMPCAVKQVPSEGLKQLKRGPQP